MKQEGEGCDYTISCGSKLVPLKYCTDIEIYKILEDCGIGKDRKLVEIRVLTESVPECVVHDIYQDYMERKGLISEKAIKRSKILAKIQQLQKEYKELE